MPLSQCSQIGGHSRGHLSHRLAGGDIDPDPWDPKMPTLTSWHLFRRNIYNAQYKYGKIIGMYEQQLTPRGNNKIIHCKLSMW